MKLKIWQRIPFSKSNFQWPKQFSANKQKTCAFDTETKTNVPHAQSFGFGFDYAFQLRISLYRQMTCYKFENFVAERSTIPNIYFKTFAPKNCSIMKLFATTTLQSTNIQSNKKTHVIY